MEMGDSARLTCLPTLVKALHNLKAEKFPTEMLRYGLHIILSKTELRGPRTNAIDYA